MSAVPANPRVLVVTSSVGSGHNQAANAIVETLAPMLPNARIDTLDTMELVPRYFRMYYAGGFKLCMTHLATLYGWGFKLLDRPQTPQRGLNERLRIRHERRALRRFIEIVEEMKPDLVVQTHFLSIPAIGWLMQQGRGPRRQAVVVTDVEAHRWWYGENVDRYFLPNEQSAKPLQRWGVGPERITISGIPLRPKWHVSLDRDMIYRDWSLPQDRPIVLLSGGAEFTVGPIVEMAAKLVAASPQACIMVLAGRNKQLLADLTKLNLPPESLRPVGYTDRMPELAEIASLMITKPGGITTAECLSRGLPMVFLKPVPGQEGLNARYFQEQGAGIITRSTNEVVHVVQGLLNSPGRLKELSDNAGRLYRPSSQIITTQLAQMLMS